MKSQIINEVSEKIGHEDFCFRKRRKNNFEDENECYCNLKEIKEFIIKSYDEGFYQALRIVDFEFHSRSHMIISASEADKFQIKKKDWNDIIKIAIKG